MWVNILYIIRYFKDLFIYFCVIASCFGLVMLLGDFIPSSGVALVLFIMVGLMLSYLTSLQPEDLEGKK